MTDVVTVDEAVEPVRCEFSLEPVDNDQLAELCGQLNANLKQIESRLHVDISNRGGLFAVEGDAQAVERAEALLQELYELAGEQPLNDEVVHLHLSNASESAPSLDDLSAQISMRRMKLRARGENQTDYLRAIRANDLTFGEGPAGTGKTYLAVAAAVELLEKDQVRRLVLVRPAVEAGERLGFLPGDLSQKIDPYLRPIYDALYEFMGFERVGKLIDRSVIEVAPLAFMRGRTLNHACIIMDEAQNTTREQMKMFLTRIGFGSKAIVTGDTSQIDLPNKSQSGLGHARELLSDVEGIGFVKFGARDVVRHPLVKRIVRAYDVDETRESGPQR